MKNPWQDVANILFVLLTLAALFFAVVLVPLTVFVWRWAM